MKTFPYLLLFAVVPLCAKAQTPTQMPNPVVPFSLTSLTSPYTQNFDTTELAPFGPGLANIGTSGNTPPGWGFVEEGTSMANNGLYTANNGSSLSADTYSYGADGSPDRAFGSLTAGTLVVRIGAIFTNNTGSVINSITISYTGEQWRQGALTGDSLAPFSFNPNASLAANNLITGTWTPFAGLDFASPNSTAPIGALDGNAAANRRTMTATLTGLNIADGQSFGIRWTDGDAASNDDGLAIDDFSMTPVPEPGTWAAGVLAVVGLTHTWFARRRLGRSLSQGVGPNAR